MMASKGKGGWGLGSIVGKRPTLYTFFYYWTAFITCIYFLKSNKAKKLIKIIFTPTMHLEPKLLF